MVADCPDQAGFDDEDAFWAALTVFSRANAARHEATARGRDAAVAARRRWPANPDGKAPALVHGEPREDAKRAGDFTDGCGVAAGVDSGRVCAGTGAAPSCQLCPESPTYWRRQEVVS